MYGQIKELEEQSGKQSKRTDIKFSHVKRVFAQRYHPDNIQSDGIDKLVREEFFKEFWEEIKKIEDTK